MSTYPRIQGLGAQADAGRGQHLLLISPTFHGYHRFIARGFEQLGYTVSTYCYDNYATTTMKVRNKGLIEMPARLGIDRAAAKQDWDTRRAIAAVRRTRADKVLVIKGDSLGDAFWEEVHGLAVPVMLWLYDDLQRHSYSMEFLRAAGSVISYARSQTELLAQEGVNAHYLPNAYDPTTYSTSPQKRVGEVVFVGSRYDNRVALMRELHEHGIPVRAYGREWSHHPFDRLRTWELSRPSIPWHRDIPLAQAYAVQADAAAAINVHGLQAGLSMRTFEVPGCGGLQLIDREDISEHYEPGKEVLVFRTPQELTELAQRLFREPRWGDSIREAGQARSLAHHTFAHRAAAANEWWV